jgi:hypothetical protein
MKRILAVLAIVFASLALSVPASADPVPPAGNPQVDNFGQCIKFLVAIGVNPSEFAPPVIGAGPSVIFPNPADPLHPFKIVGAQAWDFGVACHYEVPLP